MFLNGQKSAISAGCCYNHLRERDGKGSVSSWNQQVRTCFEWS